MRRPGQKALCREFGSSSSSESVARDVSYEKLAAVATYKSELFVCGVGSLNLRYLENYPRWSSSIWDLIARLVTVPGYSDPN